MFEWHEIRCIKWIIVCFTFMGIFSVQVVKLVRGVFFLEVALFYGKREAVEVLLELGDALPCKTSYECWNTGTETQKKKMRERKLLVFQFLSCIKLAPKMRYHSQWARLA